MRTNHDADDVARLLARLADDIASKLEATQPLNIIGIRTRGDVLANRLTTLLADRGFHHIGRGTLDITLYRDDLSEVGGHPLVRPTNLTIDINGVPMLLVDDVLFTGRSIRAALTQLADFGRTKFIKLAVLVDRGGRQLPIQADFAALKLDDVPTDHRVNVRFNETDGSDAIEVVREGAA